MKKTKDDCKLNDNNLKVVCSDNDVNILIEIKNIHIDSNLVKEGLLNILNDCADELKGDMKCIKEASKVRDVIGNNTETLAILGLSMSKTRSELLKTKKKKIIEFITSLDKFV